MNVLWTWKHKYLPVQQLRITSQKTGDFSNLTVIASNLSLIS